MLFVPGTVYMEMPLKPNILADISKDHFINAPPPREKYCDFENDQIMLEDESGRLRLTGVRIEDEMLVTGCVIAVLGTETATGEFRVIEIILPDLPPQVPRPMSNKRDANTPRYIALASGLSIAGALHESLETHLLVEYLTGELASSDDQIKSSNIQRLILAGNSLKDTASMNVEDSTVKKTSKKYGYDASAYNSKPTTTLDNLLSDICCSLPVTLMPGEHDPANASLPQQKIHPAMFPTAKAFTGTTFTTTTNPAAFEIEGVKFLGTAGQTISDIFRYVDGSDRLEMMEKTLRWRHIAPTAPDTLWCYPFQDEDQFIINDCPHVYFVGNQPTFSSTIIEGHQGQTVRLITIPQFSETGELVLLDLDTLECEIVNFKTVAGGVLY